MTDKVQKNRIADILLDFYDEYDSNVINRPTIPNIYAGKILNSLQEESVSKIWHNASEEPNMNYMIIYKCNGCTPDIGRFLGVAGIEGHFSWEIFKYPQSIIINNIEKWAYIDDIINL